MGKKRQHPLKTWLERCYPVQTQASLARDMGVTRAHIQEILRGRSMPIFPLAMDLAKHTQDVVSLADLAKWGPDKSKATGKAKR